MIQMRVDARLGSRAGPYLATSGPPFNSVGMIHIIHNAPQR